MKEKLLPECVNQIKRFKICFIANFMKFVILRHSKPLNGYYPIQAHNLYECTWDKRVFHG